MSSNRIYKTENDGKCPRCGSTHIQYLGYDDFENTAGRRCCDCGLDFKLHFKIQYEYTSYTEG